MAVFLRSWLTFDHVHGGLCLLYGHSEQLWDHCGVNGPGMIEEALHEFLNSLTVLFVEWGGSVAGCWLLSSGTICLWQCREWHILWFGGHGVLIFSCQNLCHLSCNKTYNCCKKFINSIESHKFLSILMW